MDIRRLINVLASCCIVLLLVSCVHGQTNGGSRIDDNELGMGILFDMVNIFLGDVVQPKKIAESFVNLSAVFEGGTFHGEKVDDWREWLKYAIGFTVCAAVGVVFIVVMPLAGLIFCCCRLCGRCGARPGKNGQKRSKCKRRTYCTILTVLSTITLAGVVCAFICNSLVYKHLQNDKNQGTLGHIQQSLNQIETFINSSGEGYISYVKNTYRSTSRDILDTIDASAYQAVDDVLKQLNATSLLSKATEISLKVNRTKEQLDNVSSLLSNLSSESNRVKDTLVSIGNNISNVCSSSTSGCSGFNMTQYNTTVNFSSLDNLSQQANNVTKSLELQKYIDQANQSLVEAKNQVNQSIESHINDARKAIQDVEKDIDNNLSDLRTQKNKLLEEFPNIYNKLEDGNTNIKKYSSDVYYGGIGVCCVFLLVVVLYYIGLMFGVCGEQPGEDAPCCNTGCGANFLLSGVGITFLLSWILMIICVVMFCVGGLVYTEGCRYFQGHDPAKLKDFDGLIQNIIKLDTYYKQTPPDLSISNILGDCQNNQALFSALRLDNIIDLNSTLDTSGVARELDKFKTATVNLGNVSIINSNLSQALTNFGMSGLDSVNFSVYFTELDMLSKQLVAGNLSEMASIVEIAAGKESNPTNSQILTDCAKQLRDLNDKDIPSITRKMGQLNATLTDLQKTSSILPELNELIKGLTQAQNNFNTNNTQLIKKQISALADDVLLKLNKKVATVKQEVREDLFKCQNLSGSIFAISDAVCLQTIEPVNGLWFSFGWCLFFFVPCLIFAVLLAGQYRLSDYYDKDFDETNYNSYGGPNPDTIPLTSSAVNGGSHPGNGMYNAAYGVDQRRGAPYTAYEAGQRPGTAAYQPPPRDPYLRQSITSPPPYGNGYSNGNGPKGSYSYPY